MTIVLAFNITEELSVSRKNQTQISSQALHTVNK